MGQNLSNPDHFFRMTITGDDKSMMALGQGRKSWGNNMILADAALTIGVLEKDKGAYIAIK